MRARFLRLGRSFLITIAEISLVLALIAGAIQINQWVFRYRAERLLRDILSIELRHTTFEQLSPILQRWSGRIYYDYDEPCSRQHCDLRIGISQPVELSEHYRYKRTLYLYRLFGGRPAGAIATIKVRNGFVWGESYGVVVDVQPAVETDTTANKDAPVDKDGHPGSYLLAAVIETIPLEKANWFKWPSARKRPEFRIGWRHGLGVYVGVEFTPFADPSDIKRLAEFNFSCLTRWRPCRTREDIMPVAMAELSGDKHLPWDESEAPSCDQQTTRLVSRDTDNVAVVEVIESKAAVGQKEYLRIRAKLKDRLKRTFFWEPGDEKPFEALDSPWRVPVEGFSTLKRGDRLIIMFNWRAGENAVLGFRPEECGIVPYSENNLAVVKQGVVQDDRVPPYIEYDPQFHPHKFSDSPEGPWEVLNSIHWE